MADRIFCKGFRTFPKHQNAPEFVLGSLVVTIDDFKDFINGEAKQYLTDYKGKKQLKIAITKSKDGKMVFALDTWRAEYKSAPVEQTFEEKIKTEAEVKTSLKDTSGANIPPDEDFPF